MNAALGLRADLAIMMMGCETLFLESNALLEGERAAFRGKFSGIFDAGRTRFPLEMTVF
jgi:hypothetical protein